MKLSRIRHIKYVISTYYLLCFCFTDQQNLYNLFMKNFCLPILLDVCVQRLFLGIYIETKCRPTAHFQIRYRCLKLLNEQIDVLKSVDCENYNKKCF